MTHHDADDQSEPVYEELVRRLQMMNESHGVYVSYSSRMEGEAVQQSAVHGHHIYKKVWRPDIGQELPVLPEPNNRHDSGSNLYG